MRKKERDIAASFQLRRVDPLCSRGHFFLLYFFFRSPHTSHSLANISWAICNPTKSSHSVILSLCHSVTLPLCHSVTDPIPHSARFAWRALFFSSFALRCFGVHCIASVCSRQRQSKFPEGVPNPCTTTHRCLSALPLR